MNRRARLPSPREKLIACEEPDDPQFYMPPRGLDTFQFLSLFIGMVVSSFTGMAAFVAFGEKFYFTQAQGAALTSEVRVLQYIHNIRASTSDTMQRTTDLYTGAHR